MKFRLRYISVVLAVLNIGFILLHMDMLTLKSIYEQSSRYCFNNSSHFETNVKNINYTLIDFTYETKNASAIQDHKLGNQKVILLYNTPKNYMTSQMHEQLQTCNYNNCAFTHDKNKLFTVDAIIFHVGLRKEKMGKEGNIIGKSRNPTQIRIFTSFDSPVDYFNTDYESASWHNTLNWSALYRLDKDIPQPYGSLTRNLSPPNLDYESVYNAKTKNALWLVRQCQSASARRQYVAEMVKHGFDVDILGVCGIDGKAINTEKLEQIIPTYKFYLGFETSLCNDYITERFFRNYNHNWIIVVRGGADYRRLLPTETYVNTADFSNISHLVAYLEDLGNDRTKYIDFFAPEKSV